MGEEGEDEGGPKKVGLKELLGISVSITAACIGIITNLISIAYFLRRKNKNLGDKYLILLNTLDITICILATFVNTVALKCGEYACGLFPFLENFHVDSSTMFETVVELSSLATSFLCALRAISISRPLYQISRTKVYLSSVLAVVYIIVGNVLIFTLRMEKIINDDLARVSFTMKFSLVNIVLMIIFVIMCSVVSVTELKKTRPVGEGADGNEKATKMVLILGLLFLAFNSVWMAVLVYYLAVDNMEKNKDQRPNEEEDIGTLKLLTFIVMSINSAGNPIVYMTRNEAMNSHVRVLSTRIRHVVCRC